MRTCAVCRKPSSAFLCDDPGCREAHNKRCREYQRKKRAEHVARGERYHHRWASRKRKSNTTCVDCGTPVGHGSTQETRCRRCWKVHLGTDRLSVARRKLAKAEAGTRGMRTWIVGVCARCGAAFATQRRSRYCTQKCRRVDRKVKISSSRRIAVFERDNWTCRVCGDPVNRAAEVPELDAPTIDHIVPRVRGGTHAPENLQTAHFWCNSWKSDQMDFDFAEAA